MKVRAGIIGTSGSLMAEGWAAVFGAEGTGFQVVGNASLGSSHAAMLPYRLPLLDDVAMDVLIVDLCVNEQRALNRNLHDPAQTRALFDWLRGWCADRGILPVVLILPHVTAEGLRASAVRDHWAGMCRAAGLPFLDGYRLLRLAGLLGDRPPRHFMAGQNHLNPRGARLMGEVLAATLARFLLAAQTGAETAPAHAFRHLYLGGTVARASSLLTERVARLGLGDSLAADIGPDHRVEGLVLNMAATTGALVIAGQGMRVKRLDSPHARPDAAPLIVCWSLLDPIEGQDGRAILSVQPARDMAGQEENDHCTPGPAPAVTEPVVELAGLVLRGPAAPRRLATASGCDPDLIGLLD